MGMGFTCLYFNHIWMELRMCSFHYHWLASFFLLHRLLSRWTCSCHTCWFLTWSQKHSLSLMPNYVSIFFAYSALRLVRGFCRVTIGTSALVLTTELVGKRWRGQVGMMGFFTFTVGFLSLPAIAYLNRVSSWRSLHLWTSIPGILYSMLVHFFVRESPRWLFLHGRKEEAVATLKSLAPPSQSCRFLRFPFIKKCGIMGMLTRL